MYVYIYIYIYILYIYIYIYAHTLFVMSLAMVPLCKFLTGFSSFLRHEKTTLKCTSIHMYVCMYVCIRSTTGNKPPRIERIERLFYVFYVWILNVSLQGASVDAPVKILKLVQHLQSEVLYSLVSWCTYICISETNRPLLYECFMPTLTAKSSRYILEHLVVCYSQYIYIYIYIYIYK